MSKGEITLDLNRYDVSDYLKENYQDLMKKSKETLKNLPTWEKKNYSTQPEDDLLPIDQCNKLLEPGNLSMEQGIALFPDGKMFIAVNVPFGEATGEMFEWWFSYCQLTPAYTLWHPVDHVSSSWSSLEPNVSKIEAGHHIGNTHIVDEYIGGKLGHYRIKFKDPESYPWHFKRSEFKTAGMTACICARIAAVVPVLGEVDVGYFAHTVREVEVNGEMKRELRSRFWLGDMTTYRGLNWIANNRYMRWMVGGRKVAENVMKHGYEEYSCLASILPTIYNNEIKNFSMWKQQ